MAFMTRRDFLKVLGIGTAATAAAAALASCSNDSASNSGSSSSAGSSSAAELEANDKDQVKNEKVDENTKVSDSSNRFEKIVLAYGDSLDTLTPDGGTKGGAKCPILTSMMEGLFIIQDGDYFPIMAKSYKHADDLMSTDVELHDNITDAEGNKITADDVVYSYDYFKQNGTVPKFDLYGGVEKTGDYSVRFNWTAKPEAILALEHIWGGTAVVSQKAHESHNYATDPVGTGPYKLSEFQAGLKVVLEARDDYWKTDDRPQFSQANVQTIQYDVIPEAAQRVIALESDRIDFSAGVAYDSLATFQEGGAKSADYAVDVRASGGTTTLSPNCDPSSPCSDINLRLAIFYALNNEALAIAYPLGGAVAATGLGSTYYNGYDAAWDTEENYITVYDPELAKDYLKKSSYKDETLTILCQTGNAATIAEVVQNMLLEVGIKTTINAYDYSTWLNSQKDPKNFDIIMMGAGGSNAHISLGWNRPFTNTDWGTGKTIGYVDDPKLNELLATIKTVAGGTPENVEAMRQQWMQNAYTYPTYNTKSFNVYNSNKFATLFYNCDGNLVPNACTYIMG